MAESGKIMKGPNKRSERIEKEDATAIAKKPRRPRTATQLFEMVKPYLHRKRLKDDDWRKVRASGTNNTGWNTREYDAWMAELVEPCPVKALRQT